MSADRTRRLTEAEELREAFDRAFAQPPEPHAGAVEDLLQVRVGRTAYAFRLAEISGLFAELKITPLPSDLPELLGICALRGALLPVYDLGALLGYAPEPDPRWLAVTPAGPLGLALTIFEGQVRVSHDALVADAGDGAMRHVHEAVKIAGEIRPVLSVASIVEAIRGRVRATPRKEHGH